MKRRGFGADAESLPFPFRSHIEHILMELSLPSLVSIILKCSERMVRAIAFGSTMVVRRRTSHSRVLRAMECTGS